MFSLEQFSWFVSMKSKVKIKNNFSKGFFFPSKLYFFFLSHCQVHTTFSMLINHKAIDYKIIFSPLTSGPSFLFCQKSTVFHSDPLHLLFSFRRTSHDRVTTYKSSLITPHTLFFTTAIPPILLKPYFIPSLSHTHKYIRQLRRVQPCSPYQL